jgi:hypothetical protein
LSLGGFDGGELSVNLWVQRYSGFTSRRLRKRSPSFGGGQVKFDQNHMSRNATNQALGYFPSQIS